MYLEFSLSGTSGSPSRNGMRVLTHMLVSVLYHASSDVILSDLVYMSVTCSTWSGTGLSGMRFCVLAPFHGAIICRRRHTKKKKGRPDTYIVAFPFEFPFLLRSGPLVGTSKVRWRFFLLCEFLCWLEAPFSSWFSCLVESFHCACAMSFSDEEVLNALEGIPSDGFLAESAEVRTKWMHFVASVDPDPKSLHDVMFYAIVARTLAEITGSAQPADYAEPHMRSLIVDGIKVGAAPFDKESEAVVWRSVRIQPAHVTLALRVQARAVEQYAPPSSSAIPGGDALAQVMQQYVQTRQAELKKKKVGPMTCRRVSRKLVCQACLTFQARMR